METRPKITRRISIMPITTESMADWCRKPLGADPKTPRPALEEYLGGIPRLDCLEKLPAARRCWCAATWMPSRAQRSARETSACGR